MNVNEWVILITALGGIEGIKQLLKWWHSRKTDSRKENAAASAAEIQNLLTIIDSLNKQIERLEKEMTGRNQKVDFLYAELRKSEEKCLGLLSKLHDTELKLKEADLSRCDIWDCLKRIPPRFVNAVIMNKNKNENENESTN